MSGNQTGSAKRPAQKTHNQNIIKRIGLWLFTGSLMVLGSFFLIGIAAARPHYAGFSVLLLVFHATLTIAIVHSFSDTGIGYVWRYRLAFLISACLPIINWSVVGFVKFFSQDPKMFGTIPLLNVAISLILAIIGAFLGGLIATAIDEGLWENNSPPPEQIQKEVREMHLEVIGDTGPEPISKRLFDYISAVFGILISMPIWSFITFLVWFEDPGPILFIKNSVTKGGKNFHQFKFRTMVPGAEVETGPVQAKRGDARVLLSGRFLRKTALDELPQLINILRSEMSFVGPRPQRTVLVRGYLEVLPEYAERHRVLPGLAGLAQVAGDYYLTPRQKLRFDRLYIRYRSLGFDLKLTMLAFLITFWYRWQDDWNGRFPRSFMRFGTNKPVKKT